MSCAVNHIFKNVLLHESLSPLALLTHVPFYKTTLLSANNHSVTY